MARTNKTGLDYFPLNVDFFEDDKIQLIEAEYGIQGLIVTLRLFCKIYKENYYYQWGDDQCLLFTKSVGNGVTKDFVNTLIKALAKRGILDEVLFQKYSILTSKGIQKRYFDAIKRYKKVDVVLEYLLVDIQDLVNVNIYSINVDINSKNEDINPHNGNVNVNGSRSISEKEEKSTPPQINPIVKEKMDRLEEIPLNKVFIELSEDIGWKEQMCMVHRIRGDTYEVRMKNFDDILERFYRHLTIELKIGQKSRADTLSHFSNWIKKIPK